jgi:hypothetical protein
MLGVRQPAAFLGLVRRGLIARRPAMEIVAALIFGVIVAGFTALMLVPLFFVWLMIGVYREPWPAAAGATEQPAVETEPRAEAERELERPKVMAAGRRHPLP